jgi:D-mannonate dehydratase
MPNKNLELGILILFVIVVGGAAIYYVAVKKPDEALVYITALQVFVSLLFVGVMWKQANIAKEQAKISERQTELFKLEKKPSIDICPHGEPQSQTQYYHYAIQNLSKFPIKVHQVLGDGFPGNVTDKTIRSESCTTVYWDKKPSKIEVIVSNLYEKEIKLKYIYDVNSRDLTVEEL